ncbi:MAG: hypothetical protein GX621_03455, partial [Pirellulaceae bacterium]|nr:hypothetical protein [Pirellulaceae bacterium]
FKRVGEIWYICFDGLKYQCRDSKALPDIRYLLDHVGQPVSIFHLPGNEGRGDRGTRAVDSTSLDNAKRIKSQIFQLEKRIGELGGSDDPADIMDRKEKVAERDALNKQYNENFDKYGNSRQLAGDASKAAETTKRRIGRFTKTLRNHVPGLADHLDAFLTIGSVCQYAPDRPIPWNLA